MKKLIAILLIACSFVLRGQEIPKLETFSLKNGLKVYLMQYGKIPALSINFMINTGSKNETPGQQGYCTITSELLLQGNSKYTQEQQNDIAFKLGGILGNSINNDYTTITADFLSKDLDKGMDLFSAAILRPTFNKEKLDQIVSYLMDYYNPAKMDIADLADNFSDLFIYGTANPLGRNFYKTQLLQITPEKIKEFHAFNYTPKNSSIVICGNFSGVNVKEIIEKYFGSWQSAYGEVNGVSLDMPQIKKKEVAFINRGGATQCALQWSKIAPSVKDKDLIAFNIANRIFNVVLFEQIREKGGKTYSIGNSHQPSRFSNLMVASCSVRNDEVLNTMDLFDKTLQNFYEVPITKDEFDKAVTALKVSLMSSEMPSQVISVFNPVIYDFEKRKNYLNELSVVKIEDIQRVIKKYFTPGVYKLVLSGDEAMISNQIGKIANLIKYKPADIEKDN